MSQPRRRFHPTKWVELSSPVTLGVAFFSLVALVLGFVSGGAATRALFSVYRASFADPLTYIRLFLHVLGHADFAHYAANMGLLLVLGPLVEAHWGMKRYALMLALTALLTGLVHMLISAHTAALGASGLVFMLIFLSALSGRREGKVPLTLIAVALIYLGREFYQGLGGDNISQLSHVAGALCGIAFGLVFKGKPRLAKV